MENKIILHGGKKGRTAYGHPWIYKGQIKDASPDSPGEIYSVYSSNGRFIGKGYYNPKSEISIRLLTYKDEVIDKGFFKRRIDEALKFRERFIKDTNAYRVVFSESDRLPGLIVDKYSDCVVFQILTLGMEKKKDLLVDIMKESLRPKFIYEKSDSASRRLEGLEIVKRWCGSEGVQEVEISEGGAKFIVDIVEGHKTGFYLDQRDSRVAIRDFASGRRVLDCFTHTGSFAIHSSLCGASEVLGIDIHDAQIELARKNAKLNGLSEKKITFKAANVFEALKEFDRSKARFDLVVLDPPSFVKNKKTVEGALAGYKEINLRAMKILDKGGILATFSCSGYIEEELFLQVILDAAFDTRKNVKILKRLAQSLDHPIDPFIPQTLYLKGLILEVS